MKIIVTHPTLSTEHEVEYTQLWQLLTNPVLKRFDVRFNIPTGSYPEVWIRLPNRLIVERGSTISLGRDCYIGPDVKLSGRVTIEADAYVMDGVTIHNSIIKENAIIQDHCSIGNAIIGDSAVICRHAFIMGFSYNKRFSIANGVHIPEGLCIESCPEYSSFEFQPLFMHVMKYPVMVYKDVVQVGCEVRTLAFWQKYWKHPRSRRKHFSPVRYFNERKPVLDELLRVLTAMKTFTVKPTGERKRGHKAKTSVKAIQSKPRKKKSLTQSNKRKTKRKIK